MAKSDARVVAVCAADTHLAERAWAYRPIEQDAYYAFQQLCELALAHDVPLVLAGDVLDKAINRAAPVVYMQQRLDQFHADGGVGVYYVQGQHEGDSVPWLQGCTGTRHMHKRVYAFGGLPVYGLDYQPHGALQSALKEIPKEARVLVAHQGWAPLVGDLNAPQGNVAEVPGVSALFSGDLHKHVELRTRGADGQDLLVISPGSTCMQSIDEQDDKYCYLLLSDGSFRVHRLAARKVFRTDPINTTPELDASIDVVAGWLTEWEAAEACAGLPEALRMPLLRVTYTHATSAARGRFENVFGRRAHLFFKELARTAEPAPGVVAAPAVAGAAVTLAGELPGFLEGKQLAGLKPLGARLLSAGDVLAELRHVRDEALQ